MQCLLAGRGDTTQNVETLLEAQAYFSLALGGFGGLVQCGDLVAQCHVVVVQGDFCGTVAGSVDCLLRGIGTRGVALGSEQVHAKLGAVGLELFEVLADCRLGFFYRRGDACKRIRQADQGGVKFCPAFAVSGQGCGVH